MKHGYLIALAAVGFTPTHVIAQHRQITYYYTDPQGNVLAETDEAGNIIASRDYKPYGTDLGSQPNDGPGYAGHVGDPDSELVYMQARYYDPATARFLSPDPVSPAAGNVHNFNRFEYANNEPVGNIDTDGRVVTSLNASNNATLARDINTYANGRYAFVGDRLQRVGPGNSGTSSYYAAKLDALIASPTNVILDVADTYTTNSGNVIDVDAVAGGGVTQARSDGSVVGTISGRDNNSLKDSSGSPLSATPKDILLHEIVGHIAPIVLGSDTGNAVGNENKARAEISGLKQRPPEPQHLENAEQRPTPTPKCGLPCTQ